MNLGFASLPTQPNVFAFDASQKIDESRCYVFDYAAHLSHQLNILLNRVEKKFHL
jgi:hypothetical protein